MTFVEDEVDDGEHRSESVGQVGVVRYPVRDVGGPDLALGAHEALGHRRLGDQQGPGDLRGLQPGDEPQCQCDLRLGTERRVATREDQSQAVVVHGTHFDFFVGGV